MAIHGLVWLIVLLLITGWLLGPGEGALGALERPTYTPGDRWVYTLEGALSSLPGVTSDQSRSLTLLVRGRVEVSVVGAPRATIAAAPGMGIPVTIRTSGFLNGSFTVPGPFPAPAMVSGSFTANASELWEDQGYLPVEYRGTSTYVADLSYIITTPFEVSTRFNATTALTHGPLFPLEVDQVASVTLRTHFDLNATATFLGRRVMAHNETAQTSTWSRKVVSRQKVTVEAGTFEAYRLDQEPSFLLDVLGVPSAPGGNETAFFSNDVGYFVKRDIYVDGTRVAGLTLKSYSRGPARAPSVPLLTVGGLVAGAAVAAVLGAWLLLRRRRAIPPRPPEVPPGGDPGQGGWGPGG